MRTLGGWASASQVRDAVDRHAAAAAGRPGRGGHRGAAPIGIDAEQVLRRAEPTSAAVAGAGCAVQAPVSMRPDAKKMLELSLREAVALKHRYIGTEHLLLGLLRGQSGAVPGRSPSSASPTTRCGTSSWPPSGEPADLRPVARQGSQS